MIGLYDESLNLVRGIGEIANLIRNVSEDKNALQQWLKSDEKTRRAASLALPPGRLILEKQTAFLYIATQEWYSKLCEYTHAGPNHGARFTVCLGKAWEGFSLLQKRGLNEGALLNSSTVLVPHAADWPASTLQVRRSFCRIERVSRIGGSPAAIGRLLIARLGVP